MDMNKLLYLSRADVESVDLDVSTIIDLLEKAFHEKGEGKVEIDLKEMKVDLMSMSGHKMYGPKGIGALYVRRKPRVRLEAQMHGGGHERGMRSKVMRPLLKS